MKIYKVGGAVRDHVLGIQPKDLDYVVIGSSAEQLIRLGYQKVGSGFPVFLHPGTRHEYALARGKTLEEDLYQRDLTINAMALDENGAIIDPSGGLKDLERKVLRHVCESFAEDPFRVYRVLRFKAHFPEFTIAPETVKMMKEVIASKEFDNVTTERLTKELGTVFSLERPSFFFAGLKEFNVLPHYFQELETLDGSSWNQTLRLLDRVAETNQEETARFSALCYNLRPEQTRHLCTRIQVPNDWTEAALVLSKFHGCVEKVQSLSAEALVRAFYAMDGFRKPGLVENLTTVCAANDLSIQCEVFRSCFDSVKLISSKEVSPHLRGSLIGEAILAERIKTLEKILT